MALLMSLMTMRLLNQFVRRAALVTIGFAFCLSDGASTQVKTKVPDVVPGAKPAAVERVKIHGARSKAISRATPGPRRHRIPAAELCDASRARYPVVYALHGYSIGAEQWSQEIHVPQTIEGAFAQARKR